MNKTGFLNLLKMDCNQDTSRKPAKRPLYLGSGGFKKLACRFRRTARLQLPTSNEPASQSSEHPAKRLKTDSLRQSMAAQSILSALQNDLSCQPIASPWFSDLKSLPNPYLQLKVTHI